MDHFGPAQRTIVGRQPGTGMSKSAMYLRATYHSLRRKLLRERSSIVGLRCGVIEPCRKRDEARQCTCGTHNRPKGAGLGSLNSGPIAGLSIYVLFHSTYNQEVVVSGKGWKRRRQFRRSHLITSVLCLAGLTVVPEPQLVAHWTKVMYQ